MTKFFSWTKFYTSHFYTIPLSQDVRAAGIKITDPIGPSIVVAPNMSETWKHGSIHLEISNQSEYQTWYRSKTARSGYFTLQNLKSGKFLTAIGSITGTY